MRCKRILAIIMATLVFVTAIVPVYGHSGVRKGTIIIKNGHPWQDENQQGGDPSVNPVIRIPVGPFVITIKIPTALLEKLNSKAQRPNLKQPTNLPANTNEKGQ